MKTFITLMLMVVLAGGALAQIDPDPDGIGIYFERGATVRETTTSAPFEAVTAYLLITTPSTADPISGWEAVVGVDGSPVAPAWTLEVGMDNDPDPWIFDVTIAPSPLLPAGPTVLLATWTGFVMNPADLVAFTVTGVPGSPYFPDSPGYFTEWIVPQLHPLHVTNCAGDIVAMVNGICTDTVGDEDMTFTTLKTLFR